MSGWSKSMTNRTPRPTFVAKEKEKEEDNFDRVAEMARSAYRIGQKIEGLMNIETKRYGTIYNNPNLNYANPTISVINIPAQGVLDNDRVGDSIKVQRVSWRVAISQDPSQIVSTYVRMIVFWDESNITTGTGTALATTYQLLENQGTLDGVLALLAPKDYDNRFLTKIIYDKTFTMNTSTHTIFSSVKQKSFHIGKHTQFDNGTTSIITGALKVAFIASGYNALPPPNGYTSVKGWFNVDFTDD